MLRVGAAALVLCGFMTAPVFAAPLAGVEAQFYPNEYNQPETGAVWDDLVKSDDSQSGKISESELKAMSGGKSTFILGDAQVNATSASSDASHNIDIGVDTGNIGNQKLNDVSGITTIMQNTGNGVSMQSINNINVTLK